MALAVKPSLEKSKSRDVTVLVCRGCCCGTIQKHPDVDHDAQVRTLEQAAAATTGITVRAVSCMEECSRSNVVVVRCHGAGANRTTYWLGEMLHERKTDLLAAWIARGGARTAPLPMGLALSQFLPGNDAVCAVDKIESDIASAPGEVA
jgi:predicted metal-binding protein